MSQIRSLPMRFVIATLITVGIAAFVLEKWCLAERVDGLTTNVVLLITAIVFLLQWREAFETRRLLLQESRERDRPKLAMQLEPDMKNGQTLYSIANLGVRNVEARVRFELHWTEDGKDVECSGLGLHGGEESWIVHYGQIKTGHFTLVELANNPRGLEAGQIVTYLIGRRRSDLVLSAVIKARNLEGGSEGWEVMPKYRWILRPDERTWVADHKLRP